MASLDRTDFIQDKNGDFPLEDNVVDGVYLDTPYGKSDQQHIEDGICYMLGDLKSDPTYGFGVNNYLNAEFNQSIEGNLKQMLAKDGYSVLPGCVYPATGGGFVIDAKSKIIRK